MKWILISLGSVVAVPLLFLALVYGVSEVGGEVVVLHRVRSHDADEQGIDRIRIWIVEDEQGTWVEHGGPQSAWVSALSQNQTIVLERGGETGSYRASADPSAHDHYHALRRDRYGWADALISWVSGGSESCEGIPVRVERLPI
ncbi:MAG: hypothetical protein P8M78_15800 [Myxococcota bacterium]|nr:hypothetical protein [Myxococcota bacterium]